LLQFGISLYFHINTLADTDSINACLNKIISIVPEDLESDFNCDVLILTYPQVKKKITRSFSIATIQTSADIDI